MTTDHIQIEETSSFVLSLCAVLRDIILVGASSIIWGDPIKPLQVLGYTFASIGLLFHALAKR
jgi:hypothetical protein